MARCISAKDLCRKSGINHPEYQSPGILNASTQLLYTGSKHKTASISLMTG